jgi:subtilisin family serine protease
MFDQKDEWYYFGNRKIKIQKLPDSFAVKYKENVPARSIEGKLMDQPGLAQVEERRNMPSNRLVIVTLPQTRRLADADVSASLRALDGDDDVEAIVPVYRDPQSGLRMVATDRITVRFKSDVRQDAIDKYNRENGVRIVKKDRFAQNQYILQVKDAREIFAVANRYHESGLAEFAEPAFYTDIKKATVVPYYEQWHLSNNGQGGGVEGEDIRAKEAWEISRGSPEIVVAIIDDGTDIDHPDLKPNIWQNPDPARPDVHGWNFFSGTDDPRPQKFSPPYDELSGNDSHGTPCSGVVAATGDGPQGVTGIAPRCRLLPVKVFLGDEMVEMPVLAEAIRYAGQNADVLSNSWGVPENNDVEYAIRDVVSTGRKGKGCPVFVATGNDYKGVIGFPANVEEAIAIGASTNTGVLAAYSNYGPGICLVAPSSGGTKGIYTTDVSIPGRGFNTGTTGSGDAEGLYYNQFGGTSSATPLAAGIAALILSVNPELKWDKVRAFMCDTADKIDPGSVYPYEDGYSYGYGYGRVNAFRALMAVKDAMGGSSNSQTIERKAALAIAIPDNDLEGVTSTIRIDEEGTIEAVEEVNLDISHTYRGDLIVSLISPDDTMVYLHEGQGGGADNLVMAYTVTDIPALRQLEGKSTRGKWQLKVVDRWAGDTGTLNTWGIRLRMKV